VPLFGEHGFPGSTNRMGKKRSDRGTGHQGGTNWNALPRNFDIFIERANYADKEGTRGDERLTKQSVLQNGVHRLTSLGCLCSFDFGAGGSKGVKAGGWETPISPSFVCREEKVLLPQPDMQREGIFLGEKISTALAKVSAEVKGVQVVVEG